MPPAGKGGTGGLGAVSDLLWWGPLSVCLPALAVCPSALGMVVEKAAASPPVPVGERRPQKQEPLGRKKKIRQQVTDGFTVKALMKNSVVRALLAHGGWRLTHPHAAGKQSGVKLGVSGSWAGDKTSPGVCWWLNSPSGFTGLLS